jgi:hypothetical protein
MCGWRTKLIVGLIIYFGGFATAIYYLAPESERAEGGKIVKSGFNRGGSTAQVKSSEMKKVAGAGVKKFVGFAEEKAVELGELIRAKLAEQRNNSEK